MRSHLKEDLADAVAHLEAVVTSTGTARERAFSAARKWLVYATGNLSSVPRASLTFEYRFEGERPIRVPVSSFEEASKLYRREIEVRGVGGSACYPTKLLDERGRVIAHVSYNGRVWPPGEHHAGMKALYEPR